VVVSSALALPLTNLVFSSKALLGEDAEPLSKYNLVALVLVVLGFIAYSLLGREDGTMCAMEITASELLAPQLKGFQYRLQEEVWFTSPLVGLRVPRLLLRIRLRQR
jgi:hypothetical protein